MQLPKAETSSKAKAPIQIKGNFGLAEVPFEGHEPPGTRAS